MDSELKRSIILEHYRHPHHKGLIVDDSYICINMNNESCIDEVDVMVKMDGDMIKDIRFDGEACAICTSSASIMSDIVLEKTIQQVAYIYNQYQAMLEERPYDKEALEEAIVYDDIYKQPSRKTCALLPWWAIEKVIKQFQNEKKD